jgi:hypothetical protein
MSCKTASCYVAYVQMHPACTSNLNRFFHGIDDSKPSLSDMRGIETSAFRHARAQRRDLFATAGRPIWRIFEACRQPERASIECFVHPTTHLSNLIRSCGTIRNTHDGGANWSMRNEWDDVHRRRSLFETL